MLSDGTLLKSFPNMNREASRKLFVLMDFLARSRYILEKLFSREPSGSIVLGQKFRLRMKRLEVICSYLTRSLTHVFSSPEHELLMVCYCDRLCLSSVVRALSLFLL